MFLQETFMLPVVQQLRVAGRTLWCRAKETDFRTCSCTFRALLSSFLRSRFVECEFFAALFLKQWSVLTCVHHAPTALA